MASAEGQGITIHIHDAAKSWYMVIGAKMAQVAHGKLIIKPRSLQAVQMFCQIAKSSALNAIKTQIATVEYKMTNGKPQTSHLHPLREEYHV